MNKYSFQTGACGVYFTMHCSDGKIRRISLHSGLCPDGRSVPEFFRMEARRLIEYTEGRSEFPGSAEVYDFTSISDKAMKVYRELALVPPGSVISYSALARKSGMPGAQRYTGKLMAENRFLLLFPCHRVLMSDGRIGGFSAGAAIKTELLISEKVLRRISGECCLPDARYQNINFMI